MGVMKSLSGSIRVFLQVILNWTVWEKRIGCLSELVGLECVIGCVLGVGVFVCWVGRLLWKVLSWQDSLIQREREVVQDIVRVLGFKDGGKVLEVGNV